LLKSQRSQRKKAFSLIEISVVLLLIGAIVAGITVSAKYLIKKARVSTARSLTISSVINGIPDNVLWLETSIIETSLSNTTETDGSKLGGGDAITAWSNHSNQNQDPITISAVGDGATLSNSINYIPAVQFSGSDSNYLRIADADFLNNTDYTIFITEQREASGEAYFVGADGGTDNQTLLLGYSTDSAPIHSQGSGNEYTGSIEGFSNYGNRPRTFTFISDSVDGKKMYINGTLVAEDSDTTQITGLTTLDIGKGYTGEIAEIVIFDRALKTEERNSVVDYMTTKWKAPNTRLTTADCTSGVITSTGCSQVCSAPTVNGITSSDTIADGESGSYSCNATGYTGSTPEYDCSSGTLSSPTPAITDCTDNGCDSDNDYLVVGNACVQGCTVATIIGTSDSASIVANGATVTCDETGYDGSTIGTCSAGTDVTGSCGCDTNYSDPDSNGTCTPQCILSTGDSGLPSDVYVDYGAVEYDCTEESGYTGTITFDACSASSPGDSLTSISGTCSQPGLSCTSTTDTEDTYGGDTIHIFDDVGTHTLDCSGGSTGDAWILVIGGGGGGGYSHGGGGGAGEFVEFSAQELTATSYTVTVGDGGAGGIFYGPGGSTTEIASESGDNSSFIGGAVSITALGGGAGGSNLTDGDGSDGGSGGGAGVRDTTNGIAVSGSGSLDANHFANDGGANNSPVRSSGNYLACTGGGGGAGSAGGDCNCDADSDSYCDNGINDLATSAIFGGSGGDGRASTITGSSVTYAAGGAGGCRACTSRLTGGSGGIGGDAGFDGASISAGDDDSPTQNIYDSDGTNGDANTGSGGGGGGDLSSSRGDGGNGGSGIVIIRY